MYSRYCKRLSGSCSVKKMGWRTGGEGIVHVPAHNTPIKPGRREALLIAIAQAREWMDDLAHGRVASFAAIACREGKVERHIRLLAPLAFLSPRVVSRLLDGTAPAGLTVARGGREGEEKREVM